MSLDCFSSPLVLDLKTKTKSSVLDLLGLGSALLLIIEEESAVLNAFVYPPELPLKVTGAVDVISPVIENAVVFCKLVAVTALPLISPPSTPSTVSAIIVCALIVFHLLVVLPIS